MYPHRRTFVEAGPASKQSYNFGWRNTTGLDECRETNTKETAICPGLFLFFAERFVIYDLQRFVERTFVITTVVLQGNGRVVREGIWRNEILPAKFSRVSTHFVGRKINQAFNQIRSFRPACTSIGVYGYRMG